MKGIGLLSLNSTDHKSSIVFKNRVVANVTIFSYDKAMILNMSQFSQVQYQNCDNREIVFWCITVFHYCHLVYRQKLVTIVRCHLWIGINYTKWKESCDNVCDIYFRVETIVYITTAVIITKCVSNSSYCKLIHFLISVTTWMEG